jgi:hypothetical protein
MAKLQTPAELPCPECGMRMKKRPKGTKVRYECKNSTCHVIEVRIMLHSQQTILDAIGVLA